MTTGQQLKSFIISETTTNDLEKIVLVNQKIFQGMYERDPYSLQEYQERLKNIKPKILVAKIDEKIVGNSIAFERDRKLYIWIVGVLKEHRNNGIATRFFEENEQFAKENKYLSVTTKVYNVSKEMLRMLIARGYRITDVEKSKTDPKYYAVHLELSI